MGKTYQSTVIDATVDEVWRTIRDFHDMSWAPNVIQSVEKVGDRLGHEIGAVRILNGAFVETLKVLDNEGRTFSYSIDDGPSPVSKHDVSNYVGRVRVSEATEEGGTLVEWSSSWELNDEPASEFCHSIYLALLADMKASLE
jgi:carbon monoxide dehydrogenase subunit G